MHWHLVYLFQYLTLSAYLVPRVIHSVHLLEKYYCLSSMISVSKLILLSGSDEHLERKILDPERLSRVESIFSNLSETIQKYGPWCSAWVGEAGGAYNSGGNDVSNRFLNSFWWVKLVVHFFHHFLSFLISKGWIMMFFCYIQQNNYL